MPLSACHWIEIVGPRYTEIVNVSFPVLFLRPFTGNGPFSRSDPSVTYHTVGGRTWKAGFS